MTHEDQRDRLVRFLARLGAKARSGGGDQVLAMCPVHGDVGTPSLSVRADGLFHCFSGACSVRGRSFVRLAILLSGVDRGQALALVRDYGLPEESVARDSGSQQHHAAVESIRIGRWRVNWYTAVEDASRNVRDTAADAAAWFASRRVTPDALMAASVCVDRNAATATVLFPQAGEVDENAPDGVRWIGLSTRQLGSKVYMSWFDKRRSLYLPPNVPLMAPWSDRTGPVVLVEGQIDALRVRCATSGRSGSAIYGSSLSDEQATAAIAASSTGRPIYLFFDSDKAGVMATTKALAKLGPTRCRVVIDFHGQKDPGDMIDADILLALHTAVPGGDYITNGYGRSRLLAVDQRAAADTADA